MNGQSVFPEPLRAVLRDGEWFEMTPPTAAEPGWMAWIIRRARRERLTMKVTALSYLKAALFDVRWPPEFVLAVRTNPDDTVVVEFLEVLMLTNPSGSPWSDTVWTGTYSWSASRWTLRREGPWSPPDRLGRYRKK